MYILYCDVCILSKWNHKYLCYTEIPSLAYFVCTYSETLSRFIAPCRISFKRMKQGRHSSPLFIVLLPLRKAISFTRATLSNVAVFPLKIFLTFNVHFIFIVFSNRQNENAVSRDVNLKRSHQLEVTANWFVGLKVERKCSFRDIEKY